MLEEEIKIRPQNELDEDLPKFEKIKDTSDIKSVIKNIKVEETTHQSAGKITEAFKKDLAANFNKFTKLAQESEEEEENKKDSDVENYSVELSILHSNMTDIEKIRAIQKMALANSTSNKGPRDPAFIWHDSPDRILESNF